MTRSKLNMASKGASERLRVNNEDPYGLKKIRKMAQAELVASRKRERIGKIAVAVALLAATTLVAVALWQQFHEPDGIGYSVRQRGALADLIEMTTPLGQE